MALAPCLLGYGAVAQMLNSHELTRRDGNTYWPWIQNYVAEDYTQAVRLGSGKQSYLCISQSLRSSSNALANIILSL